MSKSVLVIIAFGVLWKWGYDRGRGEDALKRRLYCAHREIREWQQDCRKLALEVYGPKLQAVEVDEDRVA